MNRLLRLLPFTFAALILAACAPASTPPPTPTIPGPPILITPQVGTAIGGTGSIGTAQVVTAESGTVLPETTFVFDTPGPFPTNTPIPPLVGGLGPTELKYRVLAEFPAFFFCDPDFYPVARADELELARQRFPDLQANAEEFNTILAHNGLTGLSQFTDDQMLQIYRDHKKLNAILFTLANGGYQFQIQVAPAEGNGEGESITALIDAQGSISVSQRQSAFVTCPICLAMGTLIDTPSGALPVESLQIGMLVWTMDASGNRIAQPILQLTRAIVPASHQVVEVTLNDGRTLRASPGHPTTDGRRFAQLQPGDTLDDARIVSARLVSYDAPATYDLLPAGDTGWYWADGVLIASTLK